MIFHPSCPTKIVFITIGHEPCVRWQPKESLFLNYILQKSLDELELHVWHFEMDLKLIELFHTKHLEKLKKKKSSEARLLAGNITRGKRKRNSQSFTNIS